MAVVYSYSCIRSYKKAAQQTYEIGRRLK